MTKQKTKSCRADGRGGWVTGHRRNTDAGDWQRIRISLAALLNEHYQHGVVSIRAAARGVGYSDTSVRRWLDGTDRPSPEAQGLVRQWIAERRAAIKRSPRTMP